MNDFKYKIKMPKLEPVPYVPDPNGGFKNYINWLKYTKKWIFVEDWYFVLPSGVTIIIPKGFIFDGASIPKIFRGFLSPVGVLFIAAIVHDWGYCYDFFVAVRHDEGGNEEWYEYKKNAGRKYWDILFKEIGNKTNKLTAINFAAWSAVRVGGFVAWNKYRKNKYPISDFKK